MTVGTTANITIVAQDPNNDTMTFSVTGTLPNGYTTLATDSSMTLSWIVTTTKVTLILLDNMLFCRGMYFLGGGGILVTLEN